MPLLPTLLILLFTSVMLGGVWLARQASQKQQETIERRQRARALKHRITEIAEISGVLLHYDGNQELLQTVTEHRIREIQRRLDYLGETDTDGELQTATAFLDSLPETLAARQPMLPTTDHDINHMKRYLFKSIRLVKLMQSNSTFMDAEANAHIKRLRIIMLKTEVNAYVQQARQLLKEEDRVNAAAHFKHAKEVLVATNLSFPERSSMIKRISKMIWGIYSTQEDDDELDVELGFSSSMPDQVDWQADAPDDDAMADVEDVTPDQMRQQRREAKADNNRDSAETSANKKTAAT